jgi:hypothetical protein
LSFARVCIANAMAPKLSTAASVRTLRNCAILLIEEGFHRHWSGRWPLVASMMIDFFVAKLACRQTDMGAGARKIISNRFRGTLRM